MKLPFQSHKQKLGKFGEDLAASYLQKHGYSIIERNFKARYGEIDIICIKDNTLIFVEVKTRVGRTFGTPEEAVTPRKLQEVIRTAEYYRLEHANLPDALRIDVIGVECDDTLARYTLHHTESVTS